VAALAATVVCGAIALATGGDDDTPTASASGGAAFVAAAPDVGAVAATTVPAGVAQAAGTPAAGIPAVPPTSVVAGDEAAVPDPVATDEACVMDGESVRFGDSGADVVCVQQALIAAGYYDGPASGEFDQATFAAAEAMQTDRNLYVDGIIGRESAISLGVWPDEQSFVIRTPAPPPGAVDLMGFPLSSVASAGDDAPPLPANSGTGRRVVYDRAGQRVWAVSAEGEIIRSWLVSGSKYSNELAGTHEVYSRSDVSTAWNGKAYLPLMIRWLKTDIGAIGFHSIPLHVEDESPYQTEAELGQRLSGGCQRQAPADAKFMWEFAQVGTKVVVV
jgi:peptidoglycan hydrolase-like protein with peptidoglycan-binding domain